MVAVLSHPCARRCRVHGCLSSPRRIPMRTPTATLTLSGLGPGVASHCLAFPNRAIHNAQIQSFLSAPPMDEDWNTTQKIWLVFTIVAFETDFYQQDVALP